MAGQMAVATDGFAICLPVTVGRITSEDSGYLAHEVQDVLPEEDVGCGRQSVTAT